MRLDKVNNITDEQLMIRIGTGDKLAYRMLMGRHLNSFLAFAFRLTGDQGEAEDIMQEAFVRVWKQGHKWDTSRKARFTTWFYRVVMNLSIDLKRKRKPSIALEEALNIETNTPRQDAQLSDKQMAIRLAKALDVLPERQRIATSLCYFQGLGNKEAAEVLGISTSAIESLLVRARARMAQLLAGQKEAFLKEII